MSELPSHCPERDIAEGRTYFPRDLRGVKYCVLALQRSGTSQESTLSYEVKGGSLDGTKGTTTLYDFARRVRPV